jgi:hypothetical protein
VRPEGSGSASGRVLPPEHPGAQAADSRELADVIDVQAICQFSRVVLGLRLQPWQAVGLLDYVGEKIDRG